MRGERIYFDYAASSPVDPAVFEFMKPFFSEKYGNPGSLHSFGQEAMAAVDFSRETIAKAIGLPAGAGFREIIFTGSATESNNFALRGVLKGFGGPARIIISSIEHESVLETAKNLERDGAEIIYLPVDKKGVVDLKILRESLNEKTILVSVMYVNNELGTIEPIEEISKIIKDFRKKNNSSYPLFHTDAAQAFKCLNANVEKLGVDLMTISGHKVYGPKGVGALFIKENIKKLLKPILTGTGQEYGIRSGTENVAGIAGFGKAVQLVMEGGEAEEKRLRELRDVFWANLKKNHPQIELNNDLEVSAPHILNIYFPSHDSKSLLIGLDMAGIAVSAGSACSARSSKPSHVLKAVNVPPERIMRSLRFSFGKFTTKGEIEEALEKISKLID